MVSMTFLHRHNHKDWVTQAIRESKPLRFIELDWTIPSEESR